MTKHNNMGGGLSTNTGNHAEEIISNMSKGFNVRDFLNCEVMSESEINRCEFWVTANRIVRESGKHNFQEAKITVNEKWNLEKMTELLGDYEDKMLMEFLRYGWPLNAQAPDVNHEVLDNQQGAKRNATDVRKYIENELHHGSIIGPFKKNPFGPEARFSPIDTRPKKDSEELRIIMNLSYPFKRRSVNESITKDVYIDNADMKVRYPSVDDLCQIIRRKIKTSGVKLFKRDLWRAYHQLWMCPGSILWLGFQFEGNLYFDVALSMGS